MLMAFIMEVERTRLTPIVVRWAVSPLVGKTTNWRAGCGRSARPVSEGGGGGSRSLPLSNEA